MRLRITFHKTEAMRYIGHLDLHRALERTLRRAGLPLEYSRGFHPQPRMQLACALPLGFTSSCEVVDAWLWEDTPIGAISEALAQVVPPGIEIVKIESIEPGLPALQTQVQSAEYLITLMDLPVNLDERIAEVLSAPSLPRERRGKKYDLRPLIEELRRFPDDETGRQRLVARLAARAGATGRPEELLDALGISPESARVHRTRLIFASEKPKP